MEVTTNEIIFLRRAVAFARVDCLLALEVVGAVGAEGASPTVLGSVRAGGV